MAYINDYGLDIDFDGVGAYGDVQFADARASGYARAGARGAYARGHASVPNPFHVPYSVGRKFVNWYDKLFGMTRPPFAPKTSRLVKASTRRRGVSRRRSAWRPAFRPGRARYGYTPRRYTRYPYRKRFSRFRRRRYF